MVSLMFFGRYWTVGVTGALTDFVVLAILAQMNIEPVVAKGLSYFTSVLVSYSLHRRWTFRSQAPIVKTGLQFALVNVASLTANVTIFSLALEITSSIFLGAVSAFMVGAMTNFLGYRYVFRERSKHE